ncbi:MAG: OmpA family protein [Gammaproteobacteria bacterium]|nr:OmpA family protein [Gammaproteobacteria bacterium]MBV9697425.1 OmpA family protein [Gammaproteobacteria bacterium]
MQSAAVIARHQLIWRDPPVWPFLWRGALPLAALLALLLYVLGPFAHGTLQSEIQHVIRDRLNAGGFGWVGLTVSGQDARLAGSEPSVGAGARALALTRDTRCPTWLGSRSCVRTASGAFTPPAVAAAPAAPLPALAPSAPAAASRAVPLSAAERCDQSLAATLAGGQLDFAPGHAQLGPQSRELIARLAGDIRTCPGRIRIEGHTDTVGRGRINRQLSQARAEAVRSALIGRGVPAQRLVALGYGARRPIADNSTEAGRARNRRIELHAMGH